MGESGRQAQGFGGLSFVLKSDWVSTPLAVLKYEDRADTQVCPYHSGLQKAPDRTTAPTVSRPPGHLTGAACWALGAG